MRLTVLLLVLLLGCGSAPPTPSPGQDPIDAMDIWWDYESNEPRANETWKGRWLYLKLPSADTIETGGKVRMEMDPYGLNYIEFDFKDDDEVLRIERFDSVVATCQLRGLQLNLWLWFSGCTSHPSEAGTVEEYLAWCGALPVLKVGGTWGELTDKAGSLLNEYEGREAPPELVDFHAAITKFLEEVYSTADDMPHGEAIVVRTLSEDPYISAALKAKNTAGKAMPLDLWQDLGAEGCR